MNTLTVIGSEMPENKTTPLLSPVTRQNIPVINLNCLHCGNIVENQYCSHCGQSITTSRFGLHHVFFRDLAHGLYNTNPGIINTLRALVTRPGHAVREYIHGKRANFLNYFSFFLLALTVLHFIHDYSHIQIQQLFVTRVSHAVLSFHDTTINNNRKLYAFIMTPVVSLVSYFIFIKAHQNFAEHLVLNIFKTSAAMLLISFFYILAFIWPNHIFLKITYVAFFVLQLAYEVVFYYQYFNAFNYTPKGLFLRSLLVAVFSMALLIDKWLIIF